MAQQKPGTQLTLSVRTSVALYCFWDLRGMWNWIIDIMCGVASLFEKVSALPLSLNSLSFIIHTNDCLLVAQSPKERGNEESTPLSVSCRWHHQARLCHHSEGQNVWWFQQVPVCCFQSWVLNRAYQTRCWTLSTFF